jgi:hypothetical protein
MIPPFGPKEKKESVLRRPAYLLQNNDRGKPIGRDKVLE